MLTRSSSANTAQATFNAGQIISGASRDAEVLNSEAPFYQYQRQQTTKSLIRSPSLNFNPETKLYSSNISGSKSLFKKKAPKTPYSRPPKPGSGKEIKIRDLKRRALSIQSTGNAPASEHQRLLLLMVFEEITPYPDEIWLSHLAVIIQR
jgi:hypothetical protein